MAHTITSEGGTNLAPAAGYALAAEAGTNLAPAVHGVIQAEGGTNLAPAAGHTLAAEAGTNLAPSVHGVIVAEAGTNLAPAVHGVIRAEGGATGAPGMEVTGALTDGTDAIIFPRLLPAPAKSGRPAWTNDGESVDTVILAGDRQFCYWVEPTFDEPTPRWLLIWEDVAAWQSTSDVATPDLATGWTAVGASTGTPVLTRTTGSIPAGYALAAEGGTNLAPAVHGGITAEGGASLAPAAPHTLVPESSY